jgi:hypothetical protein
MNVQPAIALQRMPVVEVEDRLLLPGLEPVVARNQGVVLVDLAVALSPVVELRQCDAQPEHEQLDGQLRAPAPMVDEIDDFVTGVVGNPASF